MESPFGPQGDIFYMNQALLQARKAFAKDEVPVGAVVVNGEGDIIARGHNYVEAKNSQTAHAEAQAINKAGAKVGDWRLDGYWLYVTLEPCSMCMHLCKLSRLAGVVYGAPSPLFGYHLDNDTSAQLYKRDIIKIIADVCSKEAADLLRTFFQEKRKHG